MGEARSEDGAVGAVLAASLSGRLGGVPVRFAGGQNGVYLLEGDVSFSGAPAVTQAEFVAARVNQTVRTDRETGQFSADAKEPLMSWHCALLGTSRGVPDQMSFTVAVQKPHAGAEESVDARTESVNQGMVACATALQAVIDRHRGPAAGKTTVPSR